MQLKRNKELKFETLKKSHKKQIIIGSLAVCAVGSIFTFATTKAKYKLTQDIKLVTGTVNYKVPDMRIVAVNVSEDGENYEIQNEVPTSGYTFNKDKSVCKVATEESGIENAPIDNNITIEYKDGKINFLGVTKRSTRCYLYFDKIIIPPKPQSEETLAKLNITNVNTSTPDFSQVATTNEGIFKVEDGMYGGTSYYWRGAVTNNYVQFASKCWRIVRINGDGSIRLIYDGTICHANGTSTAESVLETRTEYNSISSNSAHVGWTYEIGKQRPSDNTTVTASNAKTQTESWFSTNITGTNLDKVADGKFCNDRNVEQGTWSETGTSFQYAAYTRLKTQKIPSLACSEGDVYTLKVGALTADEVAYAGSVRDTENKKYFLYNGQHYWTMSPAEWYSSINAHVFIVYGDNWNAGGLSNCGINWGVAGIMPYLRPVINLRSDVTFSSGDGTQSNPYVVQ